MKRSRDIGEFKGRYFIISTVIFLIVGFVLFRAFNFRIDRKTNDETTQQKKDILTLEGRVVNLEKTNAEIEGELKRLRDQLQNRSKPHAIRKSPQVSTNH